MVHLWQDKTDTARFRIRVMVDFWTTIKTTSRVTGLTQHNFHLITRTLSIQFLDSILVWEDIAKSVSGYVIDQRGNTALKNWIDAVQKFNTAMPNGDENQSYKMLYKLNDSFKQVAPYIGNTDLMQYLYKLNKELGPLIKGKKLPDISEYLKGAYPQFKEKLQCTKDDCENDDDSKF